jgi:hypothetical protein
MLVSSSHDPVIEMFHSEVESIGTYRKASSQKFLGMCIFVEIFTDT